LLVVVALLCGANTQRSYARWAHDAGRPTLRRLGSTRARGSSRTTLDRLFQRVDVPAGEDASTTRTGTAPQALAILRNLTISLLHRWHRPDITAARQYFAAHPTALLKRLGRADL
jgi:hypothetical protein